jgi:hypothetical protein
MASAFKVRIGKISLQYVGKSCLPGSENINQGKSELISPKLRDAPAISAIFKTECRQHQEIKQGTLKLRGFRRSESQFVVFGPLLVVKES